jgi:hypothetical protein
VSGRIERLLLVATPAVALATVGLGLRVGAKSAVRAAVVYGAPPSHARNGLAWQVVTFEEDHESREPVALPDVSVVARSAGHEVEWRGPTNEDGAGEAWLPLESARGVHLDVRAGGSLLASGEASPAPEGTPPPGATPRTAWARFARREGRVALDVAVLGQRVPAGFPATVWVRATDAATGAALAGVTIEPEADASFAPATATARTDARGWAEVVATPVGHAVTMILRARASDGGTGVWAGALFVSPGGAEVRARPRFVPGEEPAIDVVVPTERTSVYLEVDDASGRAWAAVVPVAAPGGGMRRATVRVPPLAAGLYWAVASGDPAGAARLGAGSAVRPFFVAASDAAALAFGTDREACAPPADARDTPRVVSVCLALAAAAPSPRWPALEGFSMQHARDAERRRSGLRLALGAIAVAVLLETALLLRVSALARARLRAAAALSEDGALEPATLGRAGTVGIALLVAALGFLLLGAFLARVA